MSLSMIPLRPVAVTGYGGIAASPHALATQAALEVMAAGGNAVDGAIAANAVQGVVAPETCGIGGDLFALVTGPDQETPRALNSSGRAGSGANSRRLRDAGLDAIPQRHPAAVTVPGCVDGWITLAAELGRLPLDQVLAPAARLAERGFPANREMAAGFGHRFQELSSEPAAADMYPDGRPPSEGRRITRPELATTLKSIGAEGRAAFYAGPVGKAVSAAVEGMITPDDLAATQAEWVQPLAVNVFGREAWTVPPNSQGYIALAALAMVERLGLGEPDDPRTWHLAIEAYRSAAAARDVILADPESMTADPTALVSEASIAALADRVDPEQVSSFSPTVRAAGGTAYLCVVDEDGFGVSLIQSNFNGIGSGRSVAGAGFLLHDRGRGFTLREGHPNELTPGRRPLHTLSPTIWTGSGSLDMTLGTRGGHIQPQLVLQLACGIRGHDLDPATAMARPRWSVTVPGLDPAALEVELEPGAPDTVVEGLRAKGHMVRRLEHPQGGWGPMSAITLGSDGRRQAAADPRVDTAAAGVR